MSILFTYSLEHHRTEERAQRKLKSPAGSFQHSLTAASQTQRGTWRKKANALLFMAAFYAELKRILMQWPNMTSWKESRRNLAARAARTAEGGPISFSTCLSAEINILISLPTHARTRPKMNEMLGLSESCLVVNNILIRPFWLYLNHDIIWDHFQSQ